MSNSRTAPDTEDRTLLHSFCREGSEAAQKRGVRALAKLGRSLRARGYVLSGSALTTGLGAQFASGAPAGLATKAAAGALAAAPGLANGGFLSQAFFAMNLTKTHVAAGVVVAALLTTPIVTQQWAIAHAIDRIDELERGSDRNRDRGEAFPVIGRVPGKVAAADGSGTGNRDGTLTSAIDMAELGDDLALAEFGDLAAVIRVTEKIQPLGEAELVELLGQVPGLDLVESKRVLLADYLSNELSGYSPEEAVRLGGDLISEFSEQKSREKMAVGMGRNLRAWAVHEPLRALEWLRENEVSEGFADISLKENGGTRHTVLAESFPGFLLGNQDIALAMLGNEHPADAAALIDRVGYVRLRFLRRLILR
jgi:hypothetical protein